MRTDRTKCVLFLTIVLVALAALVAIIIYVNAVRKSYKLRVDCLPDPDPTYKKCMDRGCLWITPIEDVEPSCFFPVGYGYRQVTDVNRTRNSEIVELERIDPKLTVFGDEINKIHLEVFYETDTRLRFKITDPQKTRYEVPIDVPKPPDEKPENVTYEVSFENDPQFGLKIKRSSTGTVIIDTNIPGMVFSDQFIQISTKLPSSNVYGLGEHRTEKYRHSTSWKRWSFFSRDAAPLGDFNLYGVHPFYMNVEEDGNAHGVFLLNSNAMDVLFQPYPAITFRTIGGILDFFVFLGPTPEDVVRQYMQVIGFPMFPPYWSLGYQLSRWGYNNLSEVTDVSQRTIDAGIPYDVQFFDIDYMEEKKDFTLDENNFENLPNFINDFQKNGRKVVIILDPAIPSNLSLRGRYPPLDDGLSADIFIKLNGSILEGEVWPGICYFPDFSNDKAFFWWSKQCDVFHKKIKFDGLWVDMNEPANFVAGSTQGCENNKWNNPPYKAALLESDKDCSIYCKTLCMDAEQALGRHYDLHSLYGYFQTEVTFRTLRNLIPEKRPMVFSRSTYPGSHRYGGHWLGDNRSYWSHLRDSIPGILEFGLFGFSYIGSDICGFWEDTTEELCARWNQVGAFYPFARNHNAIGFRAQDPVAMGEIVIKATRQAVTARYQLLPYLYTLFYLSHTTGSTVARPLLHEFPRDKVTLDIDYQFLWGSALLISPAVFKGQTEIKAYFPSGNWFDFYTGKKIKSAGGRHISLEAPMNKINLHIRGGHILPLQQCNLTIKDSRSNPVELIVAPDERGNAEGSLFWDDGETWETHKKDKYSLLHFSMTQNDTTTTLNIDPKTNAENLSFDKVTILDQSEPQTVSIDNQQNSEISMDYDIDVKVIHLTKLNLNISGPHVIVIKRDTNQ